MKNFCLVAIGLLYSFLSLAAIAETKIGFVNSIQVMESAPQVEEANKRLEREFAPRQQEIVDAQQALKRLEERLAKEGPIMKESENRKLNYDVISKKRELKRQQDEFREDYNIRRNEELDKLQKDVIKVIQNLAEEESYDIIFNIEGVVWASSRVDITDQVLERLKKGFKKR